MALSEVQRGHSIAWNCPALEGGSLHHNGYKLTEELRRSSELSAAKMRSFEREDYSSYGLEKGEKENLEMRLAPEDLAEENYAKDGTGMPEQCSDMEIWAGRTKLEEHSLRGRVWSLEEENGELHKDLAAMTLKETILRDKVKDFEMQMDSHRKRVERAERTISELRQAVAHSSKQARQADGEVEELRLLCTRKDGEKQDLQNRVERLQQLCTDHEKSIHGLRQGLKNGMDGNKEGRMSRLQKELQRLSAVEITLRTDLEASRVENASLRQDINSLLERSANQQRESSMHMKRLEQALRSEIDRGQSKVAELQDENSLLFAKLRLLTRERQDTREALKTCNDRVSDLEEENQCLQEEIASAEKALEVKQEAIQSLERQLERPTQNNEVAQTALTLQEKTSPNSIIAIKMKDKEPQNAPHLGTELRQSLQAAAQHLHSMNERLEALMDKLSERDRQLQEARSDIARKDEVITDLEATVSNLAKTVDSQSSRIMRLSKRNEDLTKVSQSQARQIEEFQTRIATALDSKNKAEQELNVSRKRLEDYDKHYESQDLTCQLLQERLEAFEAELQRCQPQISSLLQQRDDLALERKNLHHSLSDVTLRVNELEHRLADKEEAVKVQEVTLEELRKEVDVGRKELILAKQERDEMQKEAESMSREALRTSMEVEVLRRRVHQLDEDLLLRDGQICILRGGLEDS
ncbi:hypothetical protein M758_8G177900 [Ceratodon purpureus]|uniref:Uncharacterized protein n=1 Tax=Ceratodon purpureus TaxID=3225 RepID=A0A8T0H2D1_CERPU|nr:hypothetical protein KC19_8G182800 [Ceratodon purpureus]KAG0609349.1 hypothetical protein M758_8G177900 [Ceratodon purpureus]